MGSEGKAMKREEEWNATHQEEDEKKINNP